MKKYCFIIISIILFVFCFSCNKKTPNDHIQVTETYSNENIESYSTWHIKGEDSYPYFLLYVNIDGSDIIDYSLGGTQSNSSGTFDIKIDLINFNILREALLKFVEWEDIAKKNKVAAFSKEIPFVLTSNNVVWRKDVFGKKHQNIKNESVINFTFIWSNVNNEGKLDLTSNMIFSDSSSADYFRLSMKGIKSNTIRLFLEKTTDENILLAIEKGRQEVLEKERQKEKREELFN